MAVIGVFLIVDALSLSDGFAKVDPVGPRLFPLVIGGGLLVFAVLLAVAITRGVHRGKPTAAKTSIRNPRATGRRWACSSGCSW